MMRKSEFLQFRASQQAAAAFLLALNLASSVNAQKLGLIFIGREQYSHIEAIDAQGPLKFWSPSVAELTLLGPNEIIPAYGILLGYVNSLFFKGQLSDDPTLWLPESRLQDSPDQVMTSTSPSTCNSTPVQMEQC